jgi:dTMP kinase
MKIVFEGIDGSGKETQARILFDRLKAGADWAYKEYPQYDTFFGGMVKNYLRGEYGGFKDLPPRLPAMLYSFDRWDDHKGEIPENIVYNRYTYSNSFHISKMPREKWEAEAQWLEDLEFGKLGLPRPDRVIFLDIPAAVSFRIKQEKQGLKSWQTAADIHEADIAVLDGARNVYRFLAERDPKHWTTISVCDAAGNRRPIDEIAEEVFLTTSD